MGTPDRTWDDGAAAVDAHAPPRAHAALVARPALWEWLDAAAAHRLTIVAAPAGYGKTTLLASWLRERCSAPGAPRAAWLTLDARHDDPARFERALGAACVAVHPGLAGAPGEPGVPLAGLLAAMAERQEQGVLVLDDYHAITDPRVHDALGRLTLRLPPSLRLVILARGAPPLPLAQLRVRGDLAELGADRLRFTEPEGAALLQLALPSYPPAELVSALMERTEGWPAALRLAGLALRDEPPGAEAAAAARLSGRHPHIAGYLVDEVLAAQPGPVQSFVLLTSGLPRLSADLCAHVTGSADAAPLLAQASAAGLFLAPAEGAPGWLRYHALFAEAMRVEAGRRLGEERVRACDASASRWYEASGMLPEAADAAFAVGDRARAAGLVQRLLDQGRLDQDIASVRRWAELLPEAERAAWPGLCLAYARAILFSEDRGDPATMRRLAAPLDQAERAWRASGDDARLGEALVVRTMALWWQGDHGQAAQIARHALTLLPPDNAQGRGVCQLHLALEALGDGRALDARELAAEARAALEQAGNGYGVRAATLVQADAARCRAELGEAAALYEQVHAAAGEDPLDRANVHVGLAAVSYARDDLAAAEAQALRAVALARELSPAVGTRLAESTLVVPASLTLARVLRARGELPAARDVLANLAAITLHSPEEELRRQVRAERAQLDLELGDVPAVRRWAAATAQQADGVSLQQQEREALVVVRWLVLSGEPAAALRAIGHWLDQAERAGRVASELELLAQAAIAHAAAGDPAKAQEALRSLVPRAAALDARRALLDAGAPMGRLLALGGDRGAAAAVVGPLRPWLLGVLASFGRAAGQAPEQAAPPVRDLAALLAEPLSGQEQRVLRLLEAGLSNPEIAEELVVSVNTVKTHLQSIYRKLGVASRREARALARRLRAGG